MEEAEGYQSLIERLGLTQEQAAEQVGRSRSAVANAMRLLQLPAAVRALVEDGSLSAGHARTLLPLESAEAIELAAKAVLEQGMSVRATEDYVKRLLAGEILPGQTVTVDVSGGELVLKS